jgi:hypothetical protein
LPGSLDFEQAVFTGRSWVVAIKSAEKTAPKEWKGSFDENLVSSVPAQSQEPSNATFARRYLKEVASFHVKTLEDLDFYPTKRPPPTTKSPT